MYHENLGTFPAFRSFISIFMDPWFWTVIFFGLAALFAVLEFFITSGGILAFLSVAALVGSVVFAFLGNPYIGAAYVLGIAVGVPMLIWYLFKWWPNTAMGRQIMLDPETDPALQPDTDLIARKELVGKRGVAKSKMMLSGLVEVEGKRLNAISEMEPIEPGEEIVVVRVDGIDLLVRKAPPMAVGDAEAASEADDVEAIVDPFA